MTRWIAVLFLVAASAPAQETLRANSTLVVTPVRVQTPNGDLVHGLEAKDFALTDNGVPQTVRLEESPAEPLAIVVLLQTGGTAPRQFPNYRGLASLLQNAFASVPYRISMVTFDSQPEDRWPFSTDAENLRTGLEKPKAGDSGAAVLNAVEYGLDWLDDQHPPGRRLLLLVSDDRFKAPADRMEHALHRLAETNTAIYSLSYSGEKQWLKDQFTHERHSNGPYFFSPDHPALSYTINLDGPLRHALHSMKENAAASVAALSGGMYLPFGDRRSFQMQLIAFANDLSNRYVLSFQPASGSAGLHGLSVRIPAHPEFQITARQAYWYDSASTRHR